jgi:pterin-4a-carbinolamine dehydratase
MTTSDLTQKHCVPCEGGDPPLPDEKIQELLPQIPDWILMDAEAKKLRKQFKFPKFMDAINFVNQVAQIAESEKHHPDIYIFYNKVQIDLYTHAVGGLSENDFILAAKINQINQG